MKWSPPASAVKLPSVQLPFVPVATVTNSPRSTTLAQVTPMLAVLSSFPSTVMVLLSGRYTLLRSLPFLLFLMTAAPDTVNVPFSTYTPPPFWVAVLPLISPPSILKVPPITYTPPPL